MDLKRRGLALVLCTAAVSGVSVFLNAYAVKGFDSAVFTFAKNLVVALVLTSVLLATALRRSLRALSRRDWLSLAGIGLVGGSLPFLLFFAGLQLSSDAAGAFVHGTLFVWAALLAVLFLKERPKRGALLGAAALLLAEFLLLRPASFGAGDILILAATVLWAAENVWAKRLLRDLSGTVVAWGRMAFGSAFLLAYILAAGKAPVAFSMGGAQLLWIVLTAAFLLAYVLTFYNGLAHVRVSTATAVLALASPITLLLDWLVRGAAVSLPELLGVLLAVVGVAIFARSGAALPAGAS